MTLTKDQRQLLTLVDGESPVPVQVEGNTWTVTGCDFPQIAVQTLVGRSMLVIERPDADAPLHLRITDSGRDAIRRPNPVTDDQRAILEAVAGAPDGTVTLHRLGGGDWRIGDSARHVYRWDAIRWLMEGDLISKRYTANPSKIIVGITDAGRAALQATEPTQAQHLPRRGDAVERWLAATLDKYPGTTAGDLLTLYRMRADAGVALDADLEG